MLVFRRFSKIFPALYIYSDDIIIGDENEEGDGCKWEFKIVEVDLGNETGVQIRMFDDAVDSLKNQKIIKALTELKGCNTLDMELRWY